MGGCAAIQNREFNNGRRKTQVPRAEEPGKSPPTPQPCFDCGDLLERKGVELKSTIASYFTSKMGLFGNSRGHINYGEPQARWRTKKKSAVL